MAIIQCANDVETLLEDLKRGKIITNICKNKYIKQMQNGLLNVIQFVAEQNKKEGSKYYLDCSKTHNKKTKDGDMMHSFFFLSKDLGKQENRMKRCQIRKQFKDTASNYAILDMVVQDIVAGRRKLPQDLMEQPIVLIRSKWMKKIARRNRKKGGRRKKVKLSVQHNCVPLTAVKS